MVLKIQDGKCKAFKLNESYELSPFRVAEINGQEHILSPLNSIFRIFGNEVHFQFKLFITSC